MIVKHLRKKVLNRFYVKKRYCRTYSKRISDIYNTETAFRTLFLKKVSDIYQPKTVPAEFPRNGKEDITGAAPPETAGLIIPPVNIKLIQNLLQRRKRL